MAVSFAPTRGCKPFLLAADIDGTLLGNADAEPWLPDYIRHFPDSLYLAYITGRSFHSVHTLILDTVLPAPDYICCHVGTEIHDYNNKNSDIDNGYRAGVDLSSWDSEEIYTAGVGPGVTRQIFTSERPRYRAGFLWDGLQESLDAFLMRLAPFRKCCIVASHAMFIDVMPDGLGKGCAVRFLQKQLGLADSEVVVAGDSGNDCSMLDGPFNAIIPSNGHEDIKSFATKTWHYHSPYPAAHGVFDGLVKFGFIKNIELHS